MLPHARSHSLGRAGERAFACTAVRTLTWRMRRGIVQSEQSYPSHPREGVIITDDNPYTLSSADAAGVLGVTSQAMRDMARKGEISHEIRARGSRMFFFFRPADVEQLRSERAPRRVGAQRES